MLTRGLAAALAVLSSLWLAPAALAQAEALGSVNDMVNAPGGLRPQYRTFRLDFWNINAMTRTTVAYASAHKPGTIVINTSARELYYVVDKSTAIRYGIGVGRTGFTWKGTKTVTAKREWPSWTPPPQMLKRQPELPRHMAGGPDNPLGARAMYLGDSLYRIHGTNDYSSIGGADSSGCFRMTNDDVIDLYNRVRIGATVIVR